MTASPASDLSAEPFGARLSRHLRGLARLAWPVILSRAGILVLTLADLFAAGRHSVAALNHISIGMAIFIPVMVGGVGFMLGVVSVVSRRHGAGDFDGAVATWRRGMAFGLMVGIAATALIWFSETWLTLIGQRPELAAGGGAVGRAMAFGALAQTLFLVCAFYLEGTGRAIPGLAAMAAANVVNIALNALVVDAYGAEGIAWATTAARFVVFFVLLWCVLADRRVRAALAHLPRGGFWGPGGWKAGAEFRAIGLAGGAANFVETAAFAAMAQAAGFIGPGALAAYTIGNSVQATLFMCALGLSVAAGVRVGGEMGAGRAGEAAFAGWTSLGATFAAIAAAGVAIVAFAPAIAGLYTDEPAIAARAAALFALIMVALLFDGGQIVLAQCLRALGDTWVSAGMLLASFGLVMTPLGWYLGVHGGLEERGLFVGIAVGCAVAVLLLSARFHVLTRRGAA